MSTFEIYDATATASTTRSSRLAAFLRRLWASHKRRRAERKAILTLASLDDRMLRDIGIEPQDVIAALHGRNAPTVLFNPMRQRTERD